LGSAFYTPAFRSPGLETGCPRQRALGARPEMCSFHEGGLDIQRIREDTRGCHKKIHLNNAGAALMPAPVSDAYVHYVRAEEEEGGYEVAAKRKDDLDCFYSACAAMLNCKPDEVAFVESASRGWALAFYSMKFKAGDRIITSAAGQDVCVVNVECSFSCQLIGIRTVPDYGSNFVAYLQARDKYGAEVVVVGDDQDGNLDMQALRREAEHERARAICVSHIPTGGGRIIPAALIGSMAHELGLIYFLDACQSVGMMQVGLPFGLSSLSVLPFITNDLRPCPPGDNCLHLATAGRRGADPMPRADGYRPQIPARPAGDGAPLCGR
jgi:cystathionine beta-lyase/cystathionine gamma-synthase